MSDAIDDDARLLGNFQSVTKFRERLKFCIFDDSVEARIDLAAAAFVLTERVGGTRRVVRSVGEL